MKIEKDVTFTDRERQQHVRVRVELALQVTGTPGLTVTHRQPASEPFDAAVRFGVLAAAEQAGLLGGSQGLAVTVFFVERQHVGPALAAVALASAWCAAQALGLPEEQVATADREAWSSRFAW